MTALILALALFAAQDQTAAPAEAAPPVPAEAAPAAPTAPSAPELPYPPGAPQDDYGLVAWCYGALGGYLELHDRMIPEVTRIEGAFRRPGSNLADDMKTYSDMQKISRNNMKLFSRAMEAAERASLQPINTRGAAAVQKGRSGWAGAANLPVRSVAQQWMGWALPARCVPTAQALEARAKLMGEAFKANEVPAEPLAATPPAVTETTPPAKSDTIVPVPVEPAPTPS
ncbi:MAG TPA: hypothetical protein VFW47_14495 [Phenylobacterium sp.]|nr:hypothetical protein [Phenylobacterium sp.]